MIDIGMRLIVGACILFAIRWTYRYARDVAANLQLPKFWMYVLVAGGIASGLVVATLGKGAGYPDAGALAGMLVVILAMAGVYGMAGSVSEPALRAKQIQ